MFALALIAILGALIAADIVTTIRALRRPGTREPNPLIRLAMRHGKLWIVLKIAISVGAAWLLRSSPGALALVCAVYALVVANTRLICNTKKAPLYYLLWAGPNKLGLKSADYILRQGERVSRSNRHGAAL